MPEDEREAYHRELIAHGEALVMRTNALLDSLERYNALLRRGLSREEAKDD